MIIDSHHHFWQYSPAEYPWIGDAMKTIRRDFLPADLKAQIAEVGVDGVVSVQARQSVAETEWLLSLADEHDFVRGVVGWVPLMEPSVGEQVERFSAHPKLKGLRHVLQDEQAEYMLVDEFNRGVSLLAPRDLVYDILIVEHQLPQAIELVDRQPNLRFVVDHIAKPRIRDNLVEPWAERLRDLARRENVWCKLSGMVTEADWTTWTEAQLKPYIDVVLEAFGPKRLMFGSDWPVCLVACGYERWFRIVQDAIAALSEDERAAILGGTAVNVYRL